MGDNELADEPSQRPSQATKPLPPADLTTDDISLVYPLNSLIYPHPPNQTLALMPIQNWRSRISSKKEVKTTSRYIAARVGYLTRSLVAQPDNETLLQKLQSLRYINLLVEISSYLRRQNPRRTITPYNKWPENTLSDQSTLPSFLVPKLLNHFLPQHQPTTYAMNLLHTTIFALTLQIPPPSLNPGVNTLITEPTDIALDLAMDRGEVNKLYRELGCKIASASEGELSRWGLEKTAKKVERGQKPKFAKLTFPIEFPKQSQGRAPARGR